MCMEFLKVAIGKMGKSEKHIRLCESHKSERVLRAYHRMVECTVTLRPSKLAFGCGSMITAGLHEIHS